MTTFLICAAWILALTAVPTTVWLILTVNHHRDMIAALRNDTRATNDLINRAFDDINAVRQRAATAIQLAEKAQGTADEASKAVPKMTTWEGYGFRLYPAERPIADVIAAMLKHLKLRVKHESATGEKVSVYEPDPNEGLSPTFVAQMVNPAVVPPTPKRKRK